MDNTPDGGEIVEDKRGRQYVEFPSGERYDCQGYVGETRIGWMCSTDFCDEIGEHAATSRTDPTPDGNKIYDSLEELQQAKGCTEECGWTKVLLVAIEKGVGYDIGARSLKDKASAF